VQPIKLESVRRKSGGRVHLTPKVPRTGPVTTLCGQTLGEASYLAADSEADCANCIRRSSDQARISTAFFAQEEGSELLRLSIEQARTRKPQLRVIPGSEPAKTARPPAREAERPVVWPEPRPPAEPAPERAGELVTGGFKQAGEGVWRSPQGVVVRVRRHGKEIRFAELVFAGEVVATRTEDGIRLRAGDVEVTPSGGGFEVRVKHSPRR
jgi:hypothetical protein